MYFFDDVLQLHRMKFGISTGAGSRSALSALKYLSFGTNPNQVGLNIRDPGCSIHKLVNELVKRESVLLFQMEADFVQKSSHLWIGVM